MHTWITSLLNGYNFMFFASETSDIFSDPLDHKFSLRIHQIVLRTFGSQCPWPKKTVVLNLWCEKNCEKNMAQRLVLDLWKQGGKLHDHIGEFYQWTGWWSKLTNAPTLRPGWYAACYCDSNCLLPRCFFFFFSGRVQLFWWKINQLLVSIWKTDENWEMDGNGVKIKECSTMFYPFILSRCNLFISSHDFPAEAMRWTIGRSSAVSWRSKFGPEIPGLTRHI